MLNLKVKMCVKCNLKEAYKKDKYPSYCADCKKENYRMLYAKKTKVEKKYYNAGRNYKLSKDVFTDLIADKKCKICDKTISGRNINIDHDHTTLKVRGILCRHCNLGLGFFRDNKKFLKNAIAYLNGFQQLCLFD